MSILLDKIKIAEAATGLSMVGLLVDGLVNELKIFVDALDSEAFMGELAPDKDDDLTRELLAIRAQGHAMLNAITEASQNSPDSKAIMAVLRRRIVTSDMDNLTASSPEIAKAVDRLDKTTAARSVIQAGGVK